MTVPVKCLLRETCGGPGWACRLCLSSLAQSAGGFSAVPPPALLPPAPCGSLASNLKKQLGSEQASCTPLSSSVLLLCNSAGTWAHVGFLPPPARAGLCWGQRRWRVHASGRQFLPQFTEGSPGCRWVSYLFPSANDFCFVPE